jgi:probable rRNA maturation factor
LIEVEVEDPAWSDALPSAEALARRAAEAALLNEGAVGEGVTLLLTDDESVRELNARFRHKDTATNVLSFPAPPNPEKHLGDVALAFGVCARQAAEQGKTLDDHLQHLVVHGVLHLLGYDHMSDDEAEAMEGLERVVLAELGVADPYAAGEGNHD